ncbi:MAG: hypothetical protein IT374_14325 [Polyangiaceae bacterium]|nr:hypothetical protein [Polyangiaceae bacterium]
MHDLEELLRSAERALDEAPDTRIINGWPAASTMKGRSWRAAAFELGGKKWGCVRGEQRPSSAQVIDAAAAYRASICAEHAVVILESDGRHDRAPGEFRQRYQAAAWHGLGIAVVEQVGGAAWVWGAGAPPGEENLLAFRALADACTTNLFTAARCDGAHWHQLAAAGNSRTAEQSVRQVIDEALLRLDFTRRPADCKFGALWRTAVADGVWRRDQPWPCSIALEVKILEDEAAPLAQVMDDLGRFDGVLHVRLGERAATHGNGMAEAMARLEERMPVRYIHVP